ncbi:MAG: decarboxylating NADP(+)-dependent phosphogluconate dehydrogenase [Acidobacteria bacterium]|nr:decarboxylating NADP(+)-dependent phosphogluconate dehydrogenase [Acidobacteriota bacterium]
MDSPSHPQNWRTAPVSPLIPGGNIVTNELADIGLVGLAVMGENLVLNMESHGFTVAVYNRTVSKVDAFTSGRAKGKNIIGTRSIADLVSSLKRPRRVMLMVKAGSAVDDFIDQLLPHLEPGDIVIDGGNSHFPDSIRRTKALEAKGLLFIGTGVSGGEEGALLGPSIMPGGSPAAWPHVAPIFQAIAAKVDDGTPCCDWVGPDGAGHFVKMVHNGIEYGDMQLICEAYQLMSQLLGMTAPEMHEVFARWNQDDLDSYLIEITRDILGFRDEDGSPLVDRILDTAGQKGTGKWTSVAALDLGVPLTLISEAVYGRCLSAMKQERVAASKVFSSQKPAFSGDRAAFVDDLEKALYASKLVSYAQGFALMRAAAKEHGWDLKYGSIALLWRGGCIIRSAFLGKIKEAFDATPDLPNLLLDPYFRSKVEEAQEAWRRVVSAAVLGGVWVPSFATALTWFDGYKSARLPANLLQAQRDYFGAHLYERIDRPRGQFFHTNWTGRGGETASSAYSV